MSQYVEQLGNDLATLDLSKLPGDEVQFIFEALADFFTKNASVLNANQGDNDGSKIQIVVNIQTNSG